MIWVEILKGFVFLRRAKNCAQQNTTVCNTPQSWIRLRLLVCLLYKVHVCPEPGLHWSPALRREARREGTLPQTPWILYAFGFLNNFDCWNFTSFYCWQLGFLITPTFIWPHVDGLTTHSLRVYHVQPPSSNSSLESQAGLMVAGCPCALYPCVTGLTGVVVTPGWCPVTWFPRGAWHLRC